MPFAGRGARLDKAVTLWRETWNGQGEFADALPAARPGGPCATLTRARDT